mmetsp:Transcript_15569/g.32023  ORF Transcript_15569/g.32023 Transcript_15569/m.32023 type:complete len:84 (-) Transcript_15569:601-852(-)
MCEWICVYVCAMQARVQEPNQTEPNPITERTKPSLPLPSRRIRPKLPRAHRRLPSRDDKIVFDPHAVPHDERAVVVGGGVIRA